MCAINWHQRAKDTDLRVRHFIDGRYQDTKPASGSENILVTKHSPRDACVPYQFGAGNGAR